MPPTFNKSVITLQENNFNELSTAGRKRVMITASGHHLCPKHAKELVSSEVISAVGYVDVQRKPRTFCEVCKRLQTFANKPFKRLK